MPNNYVLLQRVEVGAAGAASVSFTNIPQTGYTDLKVVMSSRSSVTSGSNTWEDVGIGFNGAAANNSVTSRVIFGYSTTTGSATSPTWAAGFAAAPSATANTFSNVEMYIPNYTSTVAKSYSVDASSETNAATGINGMVAGLWNPGTQAAINSIKFSIMTGTNPIFVSGSTFSLYAMAAVGVTPTVAPKASGGSITTDGTYWYHTFLASGSFVPQVALTCDALVIAGGGGVTAQSGGGGGGAGGLLAFTSQSLSATGYTCTVGAGGSGGANGVDSQFGALTLVKGGGYGGGATGVTGGSGSGGGGGAGGSGTSGQGNAGGYGYSTSSGGGGGAGQVGANGTSGGSYSGAGKGGDGSSAYSSWGATTGTGENVSGTYYYAGGGGGWGGAPSGGKGGGGSQITGSGLQNTGGGSGGYGVVGSNSGGSGIIIIRYPIA